MLLDDTYSEYVDSIAVFDPQGNLVATAPAGLLSKDATPQEEPWFSCAVEKPENLHFSQPQVQHVFSNGGELPMGGASVFGCGAHPGKKHPDRRPVDPATLQCSDRAL